MTPALRDLYQGIILEHNARPRNFGPLASPTHEARIHNPLCGDTVTLRLRLDEDRIGAVGFEGDGCALSRASASLLTLALAGKTPDEARALAGELEALLTPGATEADRAILGDLTALEGVREVPARRRCATLPWEALREALRH